MNRNAIHKICLLVLASLLAFAGTLHAGKKPDITRHEATLLENVMKITVEWQAEKPVVLLKATVGGESKEVQLDEYDDNSRDRHGFYGEAEVSIPLDPDKAFTQKDYIPYVIQIRDNLGRRSELTDRVTIRVKEAEDSYPEAEGRYHEAGGEYPGGVQVKTDDSGEYKTKQIIGDVLEIVKQHTARRENRDNKGSNEAVDSTAPGDSDEVVDSSAPVIQLNGENPLTIFVGNPYEELGAIVKDSQGNPVAGFDKIQTLYAKWKWTDEGDADYEYVEKIDTNQAGAYSVLYTFTYDTDKSVEKQRDIDVVDSSAPVIELNGENPVTISVGNPYKELGAIVKDSQGNPVAGFDKIQTLYAKWKWTDEGDADYEYVEKIDTNQAGAYSVLYTFTYDTDKSVEKQRDIDVVDGAAPVITLLPEGNPDVTIEVGKQYKDPGFKAKDKDGKDITQKVKIDKNLDTNSTGTYYVYYDVVDDYGIAAATVYRVVEVVDSTTPGDEGIKFPLLGGIGTFGKLPPPGATTGSKKPLPRIKEIGGRPATVVETQVAPPKLPLGGISAAPPPKKTTRVYYKAKSPPIGSTVIKADSPKLPPGGISAKPGVAPQSAAQPSDDKKKSDVIEMKPLR